jgi:serine/threonine-protein kinase
VPNVVGEAVADAEKAIDEAKLRSRVVKKFDETVPAGIVISQEPANGTAGKNSVVTLEVSKGPPLVEVPEVTGKPVDEARQILETQGFPVNVNQLPGGPGTVLRQTPGGGDKAPRGSTVTLYVF